MYLTSTKKNFYKKTSSHSVSGFTLVEILVSIALLSFVMLAAANALLGLVDANRKAQGLKSSIDNLSLALESMTRNMRTGNTYAGVGGAGGCGAGSQGITFNDSAGLISYTYSLSGNAILVVKSGAVNSSGSLTTSDVKIERLCFYINGTPSNDSKQPTVLMVVGGTVAGEKVRTSTRFDIQTFVTQRLTDS